MIKLFDSKENFNTIFYEINSISINRNLGILYINDKPIICYIPGMYNGISLKEFIILIEKIINQLDIFIIKSKIEKEYIYEIFINEKLELNIIRKIINTDL